MKAYTFGVNGGTITDEAPCGWRKSVSMRKTPGLRLSQAGTP